MKFSKDELRLLRELLARGGEARISGNKSHRGLDRLVGDGYVTAQSASLECVIYTLTPRGVAAAQS